MSDARSTPFFQQSSQPPFTFNSFPNQNQINPQQNNSNLLNTLQSQLRTTGQVNSELLRQHAVHNQNSAAILNMGRGRTSLPNSMIPSLNLQLNNSTSGVGGSNGVNGWVGDLSNSYQTIASATDSINSAASALIHKRKKVESTPPLSSKESSPQIDEKPVLKGKRGRKKKVTPDEAESDDEEDDQGPSKKGRRPSLNANEKRKLQNRAAQRAFRERKEKRVTDLEDKVAAQVEQLENFRSMMQGLQSENEALRRGEKLPPSTFKLPPPLERHRDDSPHDTGASSASEHDQLQVSPPQQLSPAPAPAPQPLARSRRLMEQLPNIAIPPPIASLPTYSFAHTTEPRTATSEATITSTLTLARTPRGGAQTPDGLEFKTYNSSRAQSQQQFNAQITERQQQQNFTLASPYPTSSSRPDIGDDMNFNFDFDLPFAFDSSSVPLPPLFQELYDTAFPTTPTIPGSSIAATDSPAFTAPSSVANTISTNPSEVGADDCDEPPPLPNGKLPCATCDFSVVSCDLPTPWRPPTILDDKDTWICQQAWAKVVSHPMFSDELVDELCHALKDQTKCSASGDIVILKTDVCAVFRSIPARVMSRRSKAE